MLQHQGDLVLHAEEDTAQVDVDDPVPLRFRDVGGWRDWLFDPLVERVVEAAERLDRLVQRGLDVVGLRHVAPDGDRPPAVLVDHARGFPAAGLRGIGHDDPDALTRERKRRRSSDATRRAGHERDLAHKAPLSVRWHRLLL
jgi:hypothetical protein